MSTINQRNGVLYIDYRINGERYRITVGRSKKKALEVQHKIEGDKINQKFHIPVSKRISFKELAAYWLEKYSEISNSPSHYHKNRERLDNHLIPYFGKRDINQITPRMIDEYKQSKLGKLSPATINRTLAILRKMFNDAIRWGFMSSTPMKFVKQLKEDENGFDYYSEDETRLFLKNCSEDFFLIANCAVYTGMRSGELVALEWKDVDFERRIIIVKRSSSGSTKSGKVRYIPINSNLLSVLEACEKNRKCDLVFPDKDGGMRSIDFRTEMKRAAERTGLRKIRMHDLRHTFASNYVIKGGNLVSLQKILGHSTITMTLRYAHLAPDFLAKDIERLNFETEWSLDGHQKGLVN